jgi:hypothetical protein
MDTATKQKIHLKVVLLGIFLLIGFTLYVVVMPVVHADNLGPTITNLTPFYAGFISPAASDIYLNPLQDNEVSSPDTNPYIILQDGVLSNFAADLTANSLGNTTVTLMKNGVDTPVTFFFPNGTSSHQTDIIHNFSVHIGDKIVWHVHTDTFSNDNISANIKTQIKYTSYTPITLGFDSTNFSSDSSDFYLNVGIFGGVGSNVPNLAYHVYENGTLSNFEFFVDPPGYTTDLTVTLVKNGVDTPVTFFFPNGTSSHQTDNTHNISVHGDDALAWHWHKAIPDNSFAPIGGRIKLTSLQPPNLTTTTLSSLHNTPTFGQSVNFTATVLPAPDAGTVQFQIDGIDFGNPVSLLGGLATSNNNSTLPVGIHTITAKYSGDTIFAGSSGTLIQTVGLTISGLLNTTTTADNSGNTIITGKNASATTVAQFTLPPGTTLTNTATVNYTTTSGNTVAQTSGLIVPYPPGKSIRIASNSGSTQVCIIDSPNSSLQDASCGTDLSQSMSVLNCSTAGITVTISGFPVAPTSRTYTCTISNVAGQNFIQVDGLAFSKVILDGPFTITSIVAPSIPVQVGNSITANATFADPGLRETHTTVWNWGDGTSAGTVHENSGSGFVVNTHTYTTPGVYTIQLTVTDNDGASVTSSFQYVVVYDPNGGFVTGSSSTNSTAGAYVVNPTFTGKAHFGYQVKYKTGTTIPTGDMNFNLKDGKLMKSDKDDEKDPFKFKLKATSFNWLVITGATAQFQGTGTINGTGNYGFTVTMFDGGIGGGTDKLGIKIINNNGGAVIYDTQQGTAHTTTLPLTKGNVKIHQS